LSDGELEFSGLGSVAVNTESMILVQDGWRAAAEEIQIARDRLLEAWSLSDGTSSDLAIEAVWSEVLGIEQELGALQENFEGYADMLAAAAVNYSTAEGAASWLGEFLWAATAATYGIAFAPLLVGFALFSVPELPDPPKDAEDLTKKRDLGRPVQGLMNLISNRKTVDDVGIVMASADDLLLGSLGVGGTFLLGQQGLGFTGVPAAAGLVMLGANNAGLLLDGPVRAVEQQRGTSTVPNGVKERTDRIPGTVADGDVQIRIDTYVMPDGTESFEVYIAGTESFDPLSRGEAADMTSNVAAIADRNAGMTRAVEQALAAAGVTPDSPVGFVGYSQGGLIATDLAASGRYNAQTLVTIGAPTGGAEIPASVNAIVIRHSEDLVTVADGPQRDTTALVVERQLYPQGVPDQGYIIPAHHYPQYQETARRLDASTASVAVDAVSRLDALGAGATEVTSTTYTAERADAWPATG